MGLQVLSVVRTAYSRKSLGERLERFIVVLICVLILIALSPLLLIIIPIRLLYVLALYFCVHFVWLSRGKDVLFVYSNSPVWQSYIEQKVLPRLRDRSVILNWSERSRWEKWYRSLAVACFQLFRGREFNPMAVVFRPFRRGRAFCFFRAFRDYKHGNAKTLEKAEGEFFEYLERPK